MRWPLSIADWHTLSTNQSAPTSFFLQQTRVLSWTGSNWYLDNVPCFWHPNWDRRCNLNFTSAASHSDLSWPLLCRDSDLASFFWILMARLWDPETLTFYISPKLSVGKHFQAVLPAWGMVWSPGATATATAELPMVVRLSWCALEGLSSWEFSLDESM